MGRGTGDAAGGSGDLYVGRQRRLTFYLEPEEKHEIKNTPGSLNEVLDALEADHQFLLKGGVFTQDVIDTWISYKRTREAEQVALRPHPYEFYMYYDI